MTSILRAPPRSERVQRYAAVTLAFATVLGCQATSPKQAGSPNSGQTEGEPSLVPAASEQGVGLGPTAALESVFPWAEMTFTAGPSSPGDERLDGLSRTCGDGELGLHDVAEALALATLAGMELEPDLVSYLLRKRGAPYVAPRAWSAESEGDELAPLVSAAKAWLDSEPTPAVQRCGVAVAARDGRQALVVLRAASSGELRPLPTRTKLGGRETVSIALREPALRAELVALPPRGRARKVEIPLSHGQVGSTQVSFDSRGTWLLQVMVESSGGPAPAFIARVHVDAEPAEFYRPESVPGQSAAPGHEAPADALFAMLNEARRVQRVRPLARNQRLDELAEAHSRKMASEGQLSHDSGDGLPGRRLEAAGVGFRSAGENVALAPSVERLHRALWSSPSHRENLLHPTWEQVGIGVVTDTSGRMFLTQLFLAP